jgi:nucleotide-binding universal stress UspA family protein
VRFTSALASAAGVESIVATVAQPPLPFARRPHERTAGETAGFDVVELPMAQPAEALRAFAVQREAVLLTIGAGHAGPLGRLVSGSVAEQLVVRPPCALAVVPPASAEPSSATVVGVALRPRGNSRPELLTAAALARALGARLIAFSVLEPPLPEPATMAAPARRGPSASGRVERALRRSFEPGIDLRLLHGQPGATLVDACREHADVLVLSPGSRVARTGRIGTVARDVIDHATCPLVLVTHETAAPLARALAGLYAGRAA